MFVLCRFRSLAVNEYKSLGVRIVWTAVKFPNEIELENGDIAGMHDARHEKTDLKVAVRILLLLWH